MHRMHALFQIFLQARIDTQFFRMTVFLTPELARALLNPEVNRDNRPLIESNLREIKIALRMGEWAEDTGRTVVVATHRGGEQLAEGPRLIDGQHLCYAVHETEIGVQVDLLWGADEMSWDKIDRGKKRATRDMFDQMDVPDPGAVSAMIGRLHQWESGVRTRFRLTGSPTKEEIKSTYLANRELVHAGISIGNRTAKKTGIAKSVAACAFVAIAKRNPVDDVKDWFDGLISGVGLVDGDSRLALRTYAIAKGNKAKHSSDEVFEAVIRAWNNKHQRVVRTTGDCPEVRPDVRP